MRTLMLIALAGIMALAPTFAAAQVSSGAPGSTRPMSPLQGSGGPSAGPASGNGTSTVPGASGEPSSSPSASPSEKSNDFEKYTTPADCEKAGGAWQMATNKCARK